MLDWSEFTTNGTALAARATGIEALSRTPALPNGGRLGMTRTLGDFRSSNQVQQHAWQRAP